MKGIKTIFGQFEGFWWTAITSKVMYSQMMLLSALYYLI